MSRSGKDATKPIPMSPNRRDEIMRPLARSLQGAAAFPGERLMITVTRIDGDLQELVGFHEITGNGTPHNDITTEWVAPEGFRRLQD